MASNPAVKYRELLDYIQRHGGAKVTDISRDLFLSESTVRRALSSLEAAGRLTRYHGGATAAAPAAQSFIRQQQVSHPAEKTAIGKLAASFVTEGMTLLLMGGTTVHAICPFLKGRRLTIITNSLPIIRDLAWEERIQLILLGGVFSPAEMEMRGGLMQRMLDRLHADILFTGTTGLHPVRGLMTDDPDGAESFAACVRISDQVFVLADHSKCENYCGTTVLCELQSVTCLITDNGLAESARDHYRKCAPKLYLAER